LTSDPARINISGEYTKTGNPRVAFISFEAKEFLEEWLRIRENEISIAVKRSTRYEKKAEDKRIWPFEANTAYYIWRSSIKKAQFDKRFQYNSLERFTVHPHVLRKFFRTKMGQVIPVDVTEALMGHEGYLTEVYRRYSLEDLAKFYKQGEHTLSVFAESENVSRLRAEIEERNKQLQALVNGLTAENTELKAKINALERQMAELTQKWQTLDQATKELVESQIRLVKMLKEKHPEWVAEA
jgi:hypothetical protein